jgi:hypothetical protein
MAILFAICLVGLMALFNYAGRKPQTELKRNSAPFAPTPISTEFKKKS